MRSETSIEVRHEELRGVWLTAISTSLGGHCLRQPVTNLTAEYAERRV